jgi:hypothetical protein
VALSVLWHLTPDRPFDLYALAGLGGARDEITFRTASGAEVTEDQAEAAVRLGVGLELRLSRFGVGVELEGIGLTRRDDDEAPARSGALPERSRGVRGSVTVGVYF